MQQPKDSLKSAKTGLTPEVLIERQRKTVAEHIRQEQLGNWEEVYRTFTSRDDGAYCDAVPFQHRFKGIAGVRDFYETFATAFSDLHIAVHTEVDVPGVSVREAQITGQHCGEYCGVPASGLSVSIAMIGVFVFNKTTGELNAERLYFDNNTILAQIRGDIPANETFNLGKYED